VHVLEIPSITVSRERTELHVESWKELIRLVSLRYSTTNEIVFKDMTLHKITKFYTHWFIVCPNIVPFFGWEVKPEVPCRKILRHVKDLLKSHGDG
jgi:hypothetical protein